MQVFKGGLKYSTTFFIIGILAFSYRASAQDNRETAQQMVEIADEIMRQSLAVVEARELYVTAANMDPENLRANYMAGTTTLASVNKSFAISYLLKALKIDPEYRFDLLYKIGLGNHYGYNFDEAISYYNQYLSKLDHNPTYKGADLTPRETVLRKIYECEQGKILVEFPEDVEIENLGETINSAYDDYAPLVDADESLLIFTSRRLDGNLNEVLAEDNFPYEDIYYSRKVDTTWSQPTNIGNHINTLYHDSNVGLSKDGKQLFIYKDDNQGDIFVSDLIGEEEWSKPSPLGGHINTPYSETSMSLSPDGNTMFFSSNRPDGYGGFDIWVTHKNRKGQWEKAENMGPEINTQLDEDAPFIGFDSKTMYFSSDGGEGMGGFDIYRVAYDSTTAQWSPPSNMGYPINTPDDDIYFVPAKDGRRAYYASVRDGGFGYTDIYVLKIPELLKHEDPNAVPEAPPEQKMILSPVILHVTVLNENKEKTDARVTIRPITSLESVPALFGGLGIYSFSTIKDEPVNYYLSVQKEGYQSQSIIVQYPPSINQPIIMRRTVRLVKQEEETKITAKKLRNVYFDFTKSNIKPEYNAMIQTAVNYLKSNPKAKILLVGHTDLIGSENRNQNLSEDRANAVKDVMISSGIKARRIQIRGEGSRFPLASNDQEEEGRELNRRVEFKIIN
jgi:outer membrane protein OmpA-like peptidoglycan-associated protein